MTLAECKRKPKRQRTCDYLTGKSLSCLISLHSSSGLLPHMFLLSMYSFFLSFYVFSPVSQQKDPHFYLNESVPIFSRCTCHDFHLLFHQQVIQGHRSTSSSPSPSLSSAWCTGVLWDGRWQERSRINSIVPGLSQKESSMSGISPPMKGGHPYQRHSISNYEMKNLLGNESPHNSNEKCFFSKQTQHRQRWDQKVELCF